MQMASWRRFKKDGPPSQLLPQPIALNRSTFDRFRLGTPLHSQRFVEGLLLQGVRTILATVLDQAVLAPTWTNG
jgi:hypothetical protein